MISKIARTTAVATLLAIAPSIMAMDTTIKLLDPGLRARPEARAVSVRLTDALTAITNPLGLTRTVGGGFLIELIESGVNEKRQKAAAEAFAPIATAMSDYDAMRKIADPSNDMLRRIAWMNATSAQVGTGPSEDMLSKEQLSKVLASSAAAEAVVLEYEFLLEPKFDAIQIDVFVRVLRRDGGKSTPAYAQCFAWFVPLRNPGGDVSTNAGRWAGDNAALVRQALDLGIAKIANLVPRGLELTKEQEASIKTGMGYQVGYSQKAVEDWYGQFVERDADGTLLEPKFGIWIYYFWSPETSCVASHP